MGADTGKTDDPVNRPQPVILENVIVQRDLMEQRRLRFLPWPRHRKYARSSPDLNQRPATRSSDSFSIKQAGCRRSYKKTRGAAPRVKYR
jgi:hypothetical protein